jgi:non-heme Fe2+,alpha-ketoglutarate-dependent halogenase
MQQGQPTGGRVMTPGKALKAESRDAFSARGFLSPVPSIGRDRAVALRHEIERIELLNGGALPREVLLKPHLLFPWLDAVIRDPCILDPVEDIIGPDILCWSSRLFMKNPNDGGILAWHQDLTYWGLDVSQTVVTAWVALTPAPRESGVTKVVPGTHRKLVRHQEGKKSSMLQRGQEIAVDVNEGDAVYMELATGEMSLHHGLIFHASDENLGNDRRIGFAIRYIPPSLKPLPGLPRDHVTVVRGADTFGYYDHEVAPQSELSAEALAHHRRVGERYKEIHDLSASRHAALINV